MSLKSFDKFCENMIMGEPSSQKEVFDERQNQVRQGLTIEALVICIGLSFLLVGLNETLLVWCEGGFPLMVLAAAASYLWWVIRCAVKDCLFGVKGYGTIATAFVVALDCMYLFMIFVPDGDEPFVINNGLVTNKFVVLISAFILFASFIVVLALNSRRKKRQAQAENSEK